VKTKIFDSIFARWIALSVAFGGLFLLSRNSKEIVAHSPHIIGQVVQYLPREGFVVWLYRCLNSFVYTKPKPY